MNFAARLLEWLLAPLLFLWLISLGITFFAARESVDTALDDQLNLAAYVLHQEWVDAERASSSGTPPTAFPSQTLRRLLTSDPDHPIRYLIVDHKSKPLAGDEDLAALLRKSEGDNYAVFTLAARTVNGSNTVLDEEFVRVVRYQIGAAGTDARMVVSQSRARQSALLRAILLYIAIPQSAVLLIAVFLAWYGLAYVVRPMKSLKQHLDARGGDDLRALPLQLAPTEIEPLVQSINGLMARLSHSHAAQRRFIANAAHQLRTPIAALRAHTELLAKTTNPAGRDNTIEQLLATSARAGRLANQLLSLARAESFGTTGQLGQVELNALCRSVAQEVLPLALARNIDLSFEASDAPVVVPGDATLLEELVHNLIDNALKYTPRGRSVQLSVRVQPIEIIVEDSGPGISASERERVFAPFARIARFDDGSDHAIGGTGLGLAIVEEVARAHGAEVRIQDSPLGGAAFVVRFARMENSSR